MKMWSGRFDSAPDKFFEEWQRSFPFDRRLLHEEIAASSVYARALHKAGVLDSSQLAQLLAGLHALGEEFPAGTLPEDEESEDIHHFVEKELVKRCGTTGLKVHSGRSRNEQIATDLRLYVLGAVAAIRAQLLDLCTALVAIAEASGAAVMPAYTHLQPAEPVLVAHWLLAYVSMLLRDASRLADAAARANECPLGSGAIAGSTLSLDRAFMARELGFIRPTANSMDATSDRDFAIEFVQAISQLGLHLSRWAEELIIFSTQEFGFVRLPEGYSTGSSAMPQKKNPDSLELIRAKSARVLGCAVALNTNVKGLPLAYNKDLQDTQEPLFAAIDTVTGMLTVATGFTRSLDFDYQRMSAAARRSHMNAFAAATYLAGQGVPFRTAHEVIGKAVRLCLEKGCALEELSLAELREFHPAFDEAFFRAVTVDAVLAMHDLPGGTAPARVKDAIKSVRARLEEESGRSAKEVAHANA